MWHSFDLSQNTNLLVETIFSSKIPLKTLRTPPKSTRFNSTRYQPTPHLEPLSPSVMKKPSILPMVRCYVRTSTLPIPWTTQPWLWSLASSTRSRSLTSSTSFETAPTPSITATWLHCTRTGSSGSALSTTPAGRSTGVSTYSRRERRWQWWVKERIVSSKESRGVWAQWG